MAHKTWLSNFTCYQIVDWYCSSFRCLCTTYRARKVCSRWWGHTLSSQTYSLFPGSSLSSIIGLSQQAERAPVILWMLKTNRRTSQQYISEIRGSSSYITLLLITSSTLCRKSLAFASPISMKWSSKRSRKCSPTKSVTDHCFLKIKFHLEVLLCRLLAITNKVRAP